jgi:hypothetical protein
MPSSLQDGKRKGIPRIQSLLQFIKPKDRKMQPAHEPHNAYHGSNKTRRLIAYRIASCRGGHVVGV